jgi:hypothetical protein
MSAELLMDEAPEQDERPAAAFLYPPGEMEADRSALSREFFQFSRDFWLRQSDLLPEDVGVVNQATHVTENGMRGAPTMTLLFDARSHNTEQFIWELTRVAQGRYIRQLNVDTMVTLGVAYRLNVQGQATESRALSSVEVRILQTK